MTRFDDLPAVEGTRCRWVGTTLMDREQFEAEGWIQTRSGMWRAGSLEKLQNYSRLLVDRRNREKEARIAASRRRDEQDAEFRRRYPATAPDEDERPPLKVLR